MKGNALVHTTPDPSYSGGEACGEGLKNSGWERKSLNP
jgi:hypothetical protein